ncbi:ApbE family lipoprotein [Leadbetterella byssophila DSM 17132]|uniref:FAD:protein FMN transferase n=1 Tax=Leadbetterella byssophila (strain DSM 17132 / JCM 16389 / KACC 11308 / NBRC 106382 / 4M15) TaxID=649349 RepID=E4RZ06_LEAB4|nr:FAD:protein FMN transferase [Leadbetterella byssophila]ADQ18225.1 ApbE family lipoprotein [Leadbetterella byssophila DSM 17132]
MRKLIFLLFLFHTGFSQHRKQTVLMGSVFEFVVIEEDSAKAQEYFKQVIEEIDRIENLISEWRPYTQISEVNRQAGIRPVKVNKEVLDLTLRALNYWKWSDGAFDISIVALDKVWKFDGSMDRLPTPEELAYSIRHVGSQYIEIDTLNSTIFLSKKGMKIGFGSIGKGYAADKGRELLKNLGVKGGIVNASGDLSTWGLPSQQAYWKIGIADPYRSDRILKVLKLKEDAVATSGSTEKYAEIGGKRYSHIIDPKTGWPSSSLASVTVYGPSAEFCNYLSTSLMVLGKKKGKKLVKRYPEYQAIFVKTRNRVGR